MGRTGAGYRPIDRYGVPVARPAPGYSTAEDDAYGRTPRPAPAQDASYGRPIRPAPPSRATAGRHRAGARPAARGRRRSLPLWQEVPLLLMIAFVLATLIKTFLVQAFFIPSGSMEQTLLVRDRVLVNKFVYDMRGPRRGEVVVFRGTDSWAPETGVSTNSGMLATAGRMIGGLVGAAPPDEKDFVKRVIGVGGDTVECCDSAGRVVVNGVGLVEPYVYQDNPLAERAFGPVTVPAGRLFMMGDHRVASADSRIYLGDQWRGTIPVEAVIGQAYATAWPANRWGLLQTPATFADVPTALGDPASTPGGSRRAPPRPTGAAALVVLPVLLGPLGGVCVGRVPRWLLRPDSRRHRRLRW